VVGEVGNAICVYSFYGIFLYLMNEPAVIEAVEAAISEARNG
jgi:hypothetical protein